MGESEMGTDRTIQRVWELEKFRSVLYEDEIRYEVDPETRVARITFNCPDRLNAVPLAGFAHVAALVKEAERDETVRVIVLSGEGPCFGTGADAAELGHYIGFHDAEPGERPKRPSQRRRMIPDRDLLFGAHGVEQTLYRCIKPTIAQVHSYCYGAHLQMALSCDILLAADDAMFVHPAWRYLGPIFNYGLLIETVGVRKAFEMLLTARPVQADEAEACGLATKVVPRDELARWVDDYCEAISVMPADGLAMGKAMIEMVRDARGAAVGFDSGWIGHGWLTNLKFDEGEWNFLKARAEYGLSDALRRRDEMVAPHFRMGKARNADRDG